MTLSSNFLEEIGNDQKKKRDNKINELYYLRNKNCKLIVLNCKNGWERWRRKDGGVQQICL